MIEIRKNPIPSQKSKMEANFTIQAKGPLSDAFRGTGAGTFSLACGFVRRIPYRRNREKGNLLAIFHEQCGTCSSKHAALRQLAIENSFDELELMIGVYRMNGLNTPKVSRVLKRHGIDHIPEAHGYLKYFGAIIDCTTLHSKGGDFKNDLLEEVTIEPVQAADFKTAWHKNYLQNWLVQNAALSFGLRKLWQLREACIESLRK